MASMREFNRFLTSVRVFHSWAEEERLDGDGVSLGSSPGEGNGKFPMLSECSGLSQGDRLVSSRGNSLGLELELVSPFPGSRSLLSSSFASLCSWNRAVIFSARTIQSAVDWQRGRFAISMAISGWRVSNSP